MSEAAKFPESMISTEKLHAAVMTGGKEKCFRPAVCRSRRKNKKTRIWSINWNRSGN